MARFAIPARLDGRTVEIGGTFVRYSRPALWPWLAGALVAGVLVAGALRSRPALRRPAATALGSLAGLAALGTLVVFGIADAPNGRVAWAQIVGAPATPTRVLCALAFLGGIAATASSITLRERA